MESLAELLESELKDLYSAEKQLIKALPKMAKKATSQGLKDAFLSHLQQTEGHVTRLEQIGETLEIKLTGKKCAAMEGLVEEGKEIIDEEESNAVTDAALIGAAQRVEHYEIAAYGTVRGLAKVLGQTEIVALLQKTLDEEGAADKKLTQLAEKEVLPAALELGAEEEEVEAETAK